MTTSLYLLAATATLTCLWHFIIMPTLLSPLAKIPAANFSAHISNLWILYIRWQNIENRTILHLHQRLGPIVRLAPNELSVNSYEGGLKTIYGGGFAKDEFYVRRFMNCGTTNMLCMTGNKEHAIRRRMLSQMYSKSHLMKSASLRVTARSILFDRLLPQLAESAESDKATDVFKLSYAYSMDSFMAFQFGLKLGSNFLLDSEQRDWYMDAFFSRRKWYSWYDHFPGLIDDLLRVGIHFVPRWITEASQETADWILRKCDQAEELLDSGGSLGPEDEPAIYAQERAALRRSSEKGDGSETGDYPYRWELASEMYDHSAAAMETSGDPLTYVFYEMSRHPELQRELKYELLKLDRLLKFQSGQGVELPGFKSVDNIPLLSAILQETLRRWPAVPGGQLRVTPPPACSLAGYDNIPPNVKVHSSANLLHRNPCVFPDPEEWIPNRWLQASEKETSEMNRWFWAWSRGVMSTGSSLLTATDDNAGRMCLGNNFAMNSMKLVITAVYTNFITTIIDAEGIEQDEGFTAGPKGNELMLQFHRLDTKSAV